MFGIQIIPMGGAVNSARVLYYIIGNKFVAMTLKSRINRGWRDKKMLGWAYSRDKKTGLLAMPGFRRALGPP